MSYRSVLLYLDPVTEVAELERLARQAAALFDAGGGRLTGLSCHHLALPVGQGGAPTFAPDDRLTIEMREAEDTVVAREAVFLRGCREAGLAHVAAVVDPAPALAAVCAHALAADLVVMAYPGGPAPAARAQRALVESVLGRCARPVLVLPEGGRVEPDGQVALVAWDGSAGAVAAAVAALPLLRRARRVDLARVAAPHEAADALPPELERGAAWLADHGVAVNLRPLPAEPGPGAALLAEASASQAGLLVMGAWGTRAALERLFGGTTRSVLDGLTVPTLFAR